MAFKIIPDDWILSDKLRLWTKQKGLSDKTIEDELESFRDHDYKVAKTRPDACWRNWIKNGIRWGNVETVSPSQHRGPEIISDEQREKDRILGEANLKRLREQSQSVLKMVK